MTEAAVAPGSAAAAANPRTAPSGVAWVAPDAAVGEPHPATARHAVAIITRLRNIARIMMPPKPVIAERDTLGTHGDACV